MADTNGGDVERHFMELEKQLQEDGFDPESQVMKTTSRLMKALRSDGFAFAGSEEPAAEAEAPTIEAAVRPETSEGEPVRTRNAKSKSVLRAFRAKDAFDTTVITAVFAEIEGWNTKVIEHKGHHFVIATNGQSLTMDLVKKALGEYAQEARAVPAA